MALKDTVKHLRDLLNNITTDLEKAENGNKAASQRVRTGTVKLEKIAKLYRKESIKTEKANKGSKKAPKKAAASSKTAASSKASASKASSSKSTAKKAPAKPAPSKAKVKAKPSAKTSKATAKARPLSFKKPTAKIPVRRHSAR